MEESVRVIVLANATSITRSLKLFSNNLRKKRLNVVLRMNSSLVIRTIFSGEKVALAMEDLVLATRTTEKYVVLEVPRDVLFSGVVVFTKVLAVYLGTGPKLVLTSPKLNKKETLEIKIWVEIRSVKK